jgi:hypothetical protein
MVGTTYFVGGPVSLPQGGTGSNPSRRQKPLPPALAAAAIPHLSKMEAGINDLRRGPAMTAPTLLEYGGGVASPCRVRGWAVSATRVGSS